jgi:metal-sulfur cluster biosynthetic enzyme
MNTADELVERYLKELDAELDGLPRARRREIVQEVSEHIEEARSGIHGHTEVEVRNVLERLGSPDEIADEARARFGIEPVRPGPRELWALVLLAIGGIFVPILGWLIGVTLLWGSKVWNQREKLLGTSVVPGGLALPFFMIVGGPTRVCTVANGVERDCTGGASTLYEVAFFAAVVLALASIIYLAVRLRRRTRTMGQ